MRLIISFSRYLFLVVFTLSLLTIWYINNNTDIKMLNPIYTEPFRYTEPDKTIANTKTEFVRVPEIKTKTAAPNDFVWYSIGSDLKLDHKTNSAQVKSEIRKILAEKGKFESILKAAGPYIYFIHEQTEIRHLPAEIALIPIIESEFNPYDRSTRGATGLWQLMPGTAHELGIHVKQGYDGRRNVIESTKAALAYFKDLGVEFKGNWYLAFAAYNAGQGKVASAVRHAGSTNFFNLKLSKETKIYVPRLLAVAEIIKHPKQYHIAMPPVSNEPFFTELQVKQPVDLKQFAKSSGIDFDTLQLLNPDYKNGKVPPKGPYHLLVPAEDVSVAKAKLGSKLV